MLNCSCSGTRTRCCAGTPAGFHGSSRSLTPSAARELFVVVPVRPAAERGTLCTQCFRGAGRSFFVPHLGGHVRNICGAHGLCMHTCGPNSIVPAFAAAMRAVEGTLSSTRAAVGGRIMNVTRTVRQSRGTSARSGGVLEASPWRDYSCLPFLNDLNTTARMLPAMPTCWRWPQPASGRRQEMAGACEGGAVGRPRSAPGPGSGNPALPSAPGELLPRRPAANPRPVVLDNTTVALFTIAADHPQAVSAIAQPDHGAGTQPRPAALESTTGDPAPRLRRLRRRASEFLPLPPRKP